jgi:hypothetical protein
MKRGLVQTLSMAAAFALCATGVARAEVWVELDGSGHVVGMHVPSQKNAARVWRATGEAPSQALVLNTEGAARGDGRPDVAMDPVSGMPRAVWSMRTGGNFEVVTSSFDGARWSEPTPLTSSFGIDDLDPRIAFRADGLATVVWWRNTSISDVQEAILPPGHNWIYFGAISSPTERSKLPVIRQEGSLTIVAFRTPGGGRIMPRTFVNTDFGDGPTPFPRDNGHGGPDSGDPPPDGGQ